MKCRLIMTIGPQGSGKTHWAKEFVATNKEVLYISTDELRKELGNGEHDQTVNKHIFDTMLKLLDTALARGQDVLLDATFIKPSWRKPSLAIGKKYGAALIAHVFNADRETLISRIKQRVVSGGLDIPPKVLDRYIAQFTPPTTGEFDQVINHT